MILLKLQQHLYDFWTAREWWKMEPQKGVGPAGVLCLGIPGDAYVMYLPTGGSIQVSLPEGKFVARWYDRRNGVYLEAGPVRSSEWRSPAAPDSRDWILAIEKN